MINSKSAEHLLDLASTVPDDTRISIIQKAIVSNHDGTTGYIQGYLVVGNIKRIGETKNKVGVYRADTKDSGGQIIFLSGMVGSVAGIPVKADVSRDDRIRMALDLRGWVDKWLKQPVQTVLVPKTDDEPVYAPDPDPVVINELELAAKVEPEPEVSKMPAQPGLGYEPKKKKRKKEKADSIEPQLQPSISEPPLEQEPQPQTEEP